MIEIGQIYRSVKPTGAYSSGTITRIKVVTKPLPGVFGYGKVDVVTLTEDGREIRRRALSVDQLHESAITVAGKPRRNGYILERDYTPKES